VFPGDFGVADTNWQPITNSFADGKDAFAEKWFTVGGGTTTWSMDELSLLLGGCDGGKSLTEIIKGAGYTGIMVDYEYETGLTSQQLVAFIQDFDTSMKLSFTVMGTGGGSTATATLNAALADATIMDRWEWVIPQLYDQYACLYAPQYMTVAKGLFANVAPQKVLIGIPQGVDPTSCCSDFADDHGGYVEWLYRPVPAV